MAAFRVFLIALALTAPVWVLHATSVSACTCGIQPTDQLVTHSEVILLGRVSDLRLAEPSMIPTSTLDAAVALWTVTVEEYLKGSGPDEFVGHSNTLAFIDNGDVHISTGTTPTCGYAPEADARHLLFLSRDDAGEFETYGCARNVADVAGNEQYLADFLSEIRAALASSSDVADEPTITSLGDAGTGPMGGGSEFQWLLAAAAGSGAALLLAGVALRRRPH